MALHSDPVDKREIADSLFAVKGLLPDDHYAALMDMLGEKDRGPDITGAVLVKISWDQFCVESVDEVEEGMECYTHSRVFYVWDNDKVADLVAHNPEKARFLNVADTFTSIMNPMVTRITTDLLRHIHSTFTSTGYARYSDGVICVNHLAVLAR
jgi:hypothetical protein